MTTLYIVTLENLLNPDDNAISKIYYLHRKVGKYIYLKEIDSFTNFVAVYDDKEKQYKPVDKSHEERNYIIKQITPNYIPQLVSVLEKNSMNYIEQYFNELPAIVRECKKNIPSYEFISYYAFLSYHSMLNFQFFNMEMMNNIDKESKSDPAFYSRSSSSGKTKTIHALINLLWKYPHFIQYVHEANFGSLDDDDNYGKINAVKYIMNNIYDSTNYYNKLAVEIEGGVYNKEYIFKRPITSLEADFIYDISLKNPDYLPSFKVLYAMFQNFVNRLDDDTAEMTDKIKTLYSILPQEIVYTIALCSLIYEKDGGNREDQSELFEYLFEEFSDNYIPAASEIEYMSLGFYIYWVTTKGTSIYTNTIESGRIDLIKYLSTIISKPTFIAGMERYLNGNNTQNLKKIHNFVVNEKNLIPEVEFKRLVHSLDNAVSKAIEKNDIDEFSFLLNYASDVRFYNHFCAPAVRRGSQEIIRRAFEKLILISSINNDELVQRIVIDIASRNSLIQYLVLSFINDPNYLKFMIDYKIEPEVLLQIFEKNYAKNLDKVYINLLRSLVDYFHIIHNKSRDDEEKLKKYQKDSNAIVTWYCAKGIFIYGLKFSKSEYSYFFELNEIDKIKILLEYGYTPTIIDELWALEKISYDMHEQYKLIGKKEFEKWVNEQPIIGNLDKRLLMFSEQSEVHNANCVLAAKMNLPLSYEYNRSKLFNNTEETIFDITNSVGGLISNMMYRSSELLNRQEFQNYLKREVEIVHDMRFEDPEELYSYTEFNYYIICSNDPIFIEKMHEFGFLKEYGFDSMHTDVYISNYETAYLYCIYKYSQVDGKVIRSLAPTDDKIRIPIYEINNEDITSYLNSSNMILIETLNDLFPFEIDQIYDYHLGTEKSIIFMSKNLGQQFNRRLVDAINDRLIRDEKVDQVVDYYLQLCNVQKNYPLVV